MHDENSTPTGRKQTQAERAHDLHESGLSWREVGEVMGLSRKRAKDAGHYWRNRERIAARKQLNYLRNRERILVRRREYRKANREEVAEKWRIYREANRPAINARRKAHRLRHRAAINEADRTKYAEDKNYRAVLVARVADRRAENPDCDRVYHQENRAACLMRRSIWEFGPELGPVHRALCDLRAAVRNKRETNEE